MGERTIALEREIVATREHMSRTIDLMERQFRRTVDWQTRVRQNPLPYVLAALAVGFILAGGPKRTLATISKMRPPKKTRLERLIDELPQPIAEVLAPPAKRAMELAELPADLKKKVEQVQKERQRQAEKEDEERLKKAARATSWERIALKMAEAAGTAVAGMLARQLMERLAKPDEEAKA